MRKSKVNGASSFLRKRLASKLAEHNFNVLLPEKVPCNDGGLSYGQLVVAAAKRRNIDVCWGTSKSRKENGI
jgi:hypothetical protein